MASNKQRLRIQSKQTPVFHTKTGPKSILVVEDEPVIAKLLFEILTKRLGYKTGTAATGEEAIAQLSSNSYDAILLDIRMPKLNGKNLFELLRTMNPDLPERVIFCTGDVMNPETQAFLDKRTNLCLVKPFTLHDVESVLDAFFKRRPSG
ncbi:MAG: response regulator [Nitrospirae bacterium]|nr:response regulator [Nitrospirota bacterium]